MDHLLPKLTRQALVEAVAEDLNITKAKAGPAVHRVLDQIAEALYYKRKIEIRGLGSFRVVERTSRLKVNPRTREEVPVPPKYVVQFRPGRQLKEIPMSLSMAKKRPKRMMVYTFSTEDTARRFAGMALSKMPRVQVSCDGCRVKITHADRDASQMMSLAARFSASEDRNRMKRRGAAMAVSSAKNQRAIPGQTQAPGAGTANVGASSAGTPDDPSDDQITKPQEDETVATMLYFPHDQGTEAENAEKFLRAAGCRVKRDELYVFAKGLRSKINEAVAKFRGYPARSDRSADMSMASDGPDYRAIHQQAIDKAVNKEGHGHVKTFNKGDELHSHMKKGNYAPYTLVTDKKSGEQKRIQGHSSLPVGRGAIEKVVKVTKAAGGFMVKFASPVLKAAAGAYAAKLGFDIVAQGPDYVVFREVEMVKKFIQDVVSLIMRRPVKFSHDGKGGFAMAYGKGEIIADWKFGFPQSQNMAAETANVIQRMGFKTQLMGRTVIVKGVSEDQLTDAMREAIIHYKDPGGKGFRETSVWTAPGRTTHDVVTGSARTSGGTAYDDPKKGLKDVFFQYVVDFASEVGLEKASQALRKLGIDIHNAGGGLLAIGLKAVLSKSVEEIIARYRGRVVQKKQSSSPKAPQVSTKSNQGGLFNRIFGGKKAPTGAPQQGPPLAPLEPRAPKKPMVVQPPKNNEGYKTAGKKGTKSRKAAPGIFSNEPTVAAGLDYIAIAYAVMDFISDQTTRAIADKLTQQGIKFIQHGSREIIAKVQDPAQLDKLKGMVKSVKGRLRLKRTPVEGQKRVAKSASMSGEVALAAPFGPAAWYWLGFSSPFAAATAAGVLAAIAIPYSLREAYLGIKGTTYAVKKAIAYLKQRFGAKDVKAPPPETKAASMASDEIIKRPKWTKVDHPDDAKYNEAWSRYEQARRRYAQGKGPRPGAFNPGGADVPNWVDHVGKAVSKAYKKNPALVGAAGLVAYIVVSGSVLAAVGLQLEKAGIAVRRVGRKLAAKITGVKDLEQIKRIVAKNGGSVQVEKGEEKAASMSAMPRRFTTDDRLKAQAVILVGMGVYKAVKALRRAGIKAKQQSEMLAKIDVTDEKQLQAVADIAKEEHLTLKKEIEANEKAHSPVFRTAAKVGKGILGAAALYVAYATIPKSTLQRAMAELAALGVKIAKKREDAHRGEVKVTQLTPEQLASLKQVVNRAGGKLKIGSSASLEGDLHQKFGNEIAKPKRQLRKAKRRVAKPKPAVEEPAPQFEPAVRAGHQVVFSVN